jgi:protoheme ferro-lyase
MQNNLGVLVLGHGSSLPYNKEVVSAVAEMISKSDENMVVKSAFLNLDTPTLHEGLKSFEGTGVERIVALPCLPGTGCHTASQRSPLQIRSLCLTTGKWSKQGRMMIWLSERGCMHG